jgi:hypothetical protein
MELSGEVSLDSVIESEPLRSTPLIGQFFTLIKFGLNIRDLFFAQKIKCFLEGLNEEKIDKLREKLRIDENYRTRFTQKLVLLLDRISDLEKATILATIVGAFAEDLIDRTTMEKLFDSVDRLFIHDVQVLIEFYNIQGKGRDFIPPHYESLQNLAMSGLVALGLTSASGGVISGGTEWFNPNRSGETLVTILQGGVPSLRRF